MADSSVYFEAMVNEHSPISHEGIRQISTPLSGQGIDNLASFDIEDRDRTPFQRPNPMFKAKAQANFRPNVQDRDPTLYADANPASESLSIHPTPAGIKDAQFQSRNRFVTNKNTYKPETISSSVSTRRKSETSQEYQENASRGRYGWANLWADPNTPYMISLYLQLILNVVIIGSILYYIYRFVRTVQSDISHRLEMYISDALQEISLCSREYYRNKCAIEDGHKRVPALERQCTAWSKCMNRDPQLIGKSKIGAETFADIVNGFIQPISWKSLMFINIFVIGSLISTNLAFRSYRNSSSVSKSAKKSIQLMGERLKEQDLLIEKYELELSRDRGISPQGLLSDSVPQQRLESPHILRSSDVGQFEDISFNSPLSGRSNYANNYR